jgi:large subunit ribosomal protein L13e
VQVAGIPARVAPTIGIAVDHRRRNHCEESLTLNADRLKAYKARLVVFPRAGSAPKAGDAARADAAGMQQIRGPLMPPTKAAPALEMAAVTDDMKARGRC